MLNADVYYLDYRPDENSSLKRLTSCSFHVTYTVFIKSSIFTAGTLCLVRLPNIIFNWGEISVTDCVS